MKEWIYRFLQALPNQNTVAAYRNDLEQFVEFLSTFESVAAPRVTRLADVSEKHFQEYRFFLQERGYAKSTLARKLAAVRALYRFLEEQSVAKSDATQALGHQPVVRHDPEILSRKEILDLLGAPERCQSRYPLRDRAMLYLLYYTELRASTLLDINIGNVAEDGISLLFEGVEGNWKTLPQPAQPPLSSLLFDLRERGAADEHPLFQNHRGNRLTRQGMWTIVKSYIPYTEIRGRLTLEALRHSRAAHKLEAEDRIPR